MNLLMVIMEIPKSLNTNMGNTKISGTQLRTFESHGTKTGKNQNLLGTKWEIYIFGLRWYILEKQASFVHLRESVGLKFDGRSTLFVWILGHANIILCGYQPRPIVMETFGPKLDPSI